MSVTGGDQVVAGDPRYRVKPIGHVRRLGPITGSDPGRARIEIEAAYRDGLFELGEFSHVLVLWWAHRRDNPEDRGTLRVRPRAAPDHVTGVFATRSPARPNPIAVSVCRLLAVDEAAGTLDVAAIDADDGTAVIDLKAYFPSADRVREPTVPVWFAGKPEWLNDEPDAT
jgi:tRNA (adenine37-N6)-methyltransferase